jgi:hypothetical protein
MSLLSVGVVKIIKTIVIKIVKLLKLLAAGHIYMLKPVTCNNIVITVFRKGLTHCMTI